MNTINPIAITMGDPSGIGTEITLKAWKSGKIKQPFFLIHDLEFVNSVARKMKIDIPLVRIEDPSQARNLYKKSLPIYQLSSIKKTQLGKPKKQNAKLIIESINLALNFVKKNKASAIVTNPIAKNIINYHIKNFRGHTEYLAAKTRSKNFSMMLINKKIKVIPLTIHIALKDVSKSINKKNLSEALKSIKKSLKEDFKIKRPKILVTGLNPHSGEDGQIGQEEKKIIEPTINNLRKNMHVYGPISADTAFTQKNLKTYDAVLCMYHDQALIPVKTIDFYNTINFTAGLNIIRTSPDHGTGFDIASKFIANENSLVEAIKMAEQIVKNRNSIK